MREAAVERPQTRARARGCLLCVWDKRICKLTVEVGSAGFSGGCVRLDRVASTSMISSAETCAVVVSPRASDCTVTSLVCIRHRTRESGFSSLLGWSVVDRRIRICVRLKG